MISVPIPATTGMTTGRQDYIVFNCRAIKQITNVRRQDIVVRLRGLYVGRERGNDRAILK